MKVVVPVFKGAINASIIGILDMINYTKYFYAQFYGLQEFKEVFIAELMSIEENLTIDNAGLNINTHFLWKDFIQADIILIPGFIGDLLALCDHHQDFIDWIKEKHSQGVIICSNCSGAFFIAKTGLLNGKKATTSWFHENLFRKTFPNIELTIDQLIVEQDSIITGGATLSYMNLCIYLVEKFYGKEFSTYVAKMFLVEKSKSIQTPFSIFNPTQNGKTLGIKKAQEIMSMEENQKLTITDIASLVLMSERTFIRKFKDETGYPPIQYFQKLKIEKAKKLLEEGNLNIKEISFRSGYEDLDFFRSLFKKFTGKTPQEYRKLFVFNILE